MRRIRRNLSTSTKYLQLAQELTAQELSEEHQQLVSEAIDLLRADIEYDKEMIARKGMEELVNTGLAAVGNALSHDFGMTNQDDVFATEIHDECDDLLNNMYMDLEKLKKEYL